jgi:hypothetical protein
VITARETVQERQEGKKPEMVDAKRLEKVLEEKTPRVGLA